MSIVYELGDASMKEQLVHALVNTLTGAARKKKAIKVDNVFSIFILTIEITLCFKYLNVLALADGGF
jgi:hypothetical protein